MIPFFPLTCRHRNGAGMALVITLGAVVLITVLIVTFFSNSIRNRQISYSNTNSVKADQLTRSALEIITGEIREEIADPAFSSASNGGNVDYPVFFRPLAADNAIPRKVGTSGTSAWILKVSGSDSAINPGSNGRRMGSAQMIDAPSRNGRYLSADRWFGSGSPALGTGTTDTLPTWVYITRSGVKTPALADAATPSANDYVIGRFAYTVYNQGGLLDANVAGYPNVASSAAPYKSSLAFADIGSILGITDLASWRNGSTGADSSTFTQWAAGLASTSGTNLGAMSAAASGHLSAVAGDNVFFSRRDLLLAAQHSVAGLSATHTDLLTHFSRTVNAPSWAPKTITTANPDLGGVRFKSPTAITHYDDAGVSSQYYIMPGDPLIQHRFSLAKVRWITASGPAPGISGAAIQAAFGLAWNTTASRWDYVGGTESTIQPSIETLDQVAGENREPNFFELLKAGIVEGSLGKASANQTLAQPDQMTLEGNKDFQTFQIGVNIIDCAGADNYPTRMGYGSAASPYMVYGIKDLPYLYGVKTNHFSSRTLVNPTQERMDYCYLVLVPELFNPHASGITPATGVSDIRVRISNGTVSSAYPSNVGKTAPLSRDNLALNLADPAGNRAIVVPSSSFDAFRTAMKPVQNTEATSDTTFGTVINKNLAANAAIASNTDTPQSSQIHGFLYYQYSGLPSTLYTTGDFDIRSEFNNLFIVLEYKDASGKWRIYDTWSGNEALSTQTGMGKTGTGFDFGPHSDITAATSPLIRANLNSGTASWKIDPRTTRFVGSGSNPNSGPGPLSTPVGPLSGAGAWGGFNNYTPFSPAPGNNSFYPGNWLTWKTGGTTKTGWGGSGYADNVADADGNLRPPDGWLGGAADFFSNMSQTGASTGRPIILHRPYRSVAELGYVFRATPWKTLSFFDDSSADGALLDLFAVSDEPTVVAGRVDLNSAHSAMQQALLNGAGQSYEGSNPLPSPASIATAYQSYAYTSGSASTTLLTNLAQLPSFMTSTALKSAYPTSSNPIKSYREAVVRGLTAGTQTRTWNLLIDVVGQVGRFQTGSTPSSLANFIVEGEKRYWLSIAIDRYTGKVIDEQLEPADE